MGEPVLELKRVTRTFGAVRAAQSVELSLEPGEIHALIGPNGAGKSTIINIISGAIHPDSGSVHFCGNDVTRLGVANRARAGLGRSFQISALAMEHSVLQNAMLGALGRTGNAFRMFRPAASDLALVKAAESALERTDLIDLKDRICGSLSHGQRRLLEVAVALTLEPKAFLMDEPMAGLGADGTQRMTRLLDTLRIEAPILMVEHDMDAVFSLADRISVLVQGQIIATGSPETIRKDPLVQRAYLGNKDQP